MDNCLDTGDNHKIHNDFHKDKQDLDTRDYVWKTA